MISIFINEPVKLEKKSPKKCFTYIKIITQHSIKF